MSDDVLTSLFPVRKKGIEPEVIVFKDPVRKRSKVVKSSEVPDVKFDHSETDVREIAKDVNMFGISGLDRKEQKKVQQAHAEKLGAKRQKRKSGPYPQVMLMLKKQKMKAEKEAELAAAMGEHLKKKQPKKEKPLRKRKLGRWIDKSNLSRDAQNNSISVDKHVIKKFV